MMRQTSRWRAGARGIALYLPAVAVLSMVLLAHAVDWVQASSVLRDPLAVADAPFYWGMVSALGGLLWAGTVGACLLGALVLRRTSGAAVATRYLMAAAILNTFLGLDDVFQIHEAVVPRYVGLPEIGTYICYALALLTWVAMFWSYLLTQPDRPLLASATVLLALSLGMDLVNTMADDRFLYGVEDMFKYLGLYGWCLYWFRSARHHLMATTEAGLASSRPQASLFPGGEDVPLIVGSSVGDLRRDAS